MAAQDALIAVWSTGRPGGITGTNFVAGDPAITKIAAILTWRAATGVPIKAWLTPSSILNACVPADLASLTQLQTTQLSVLLSGSLVDASVGSSVRAAIRALFAGKATTLSQLTTLVTEFDSPTIPWWQSIGYGSEICLGDARVAGLN